MDNLENRIKGAIFGLAIGDALGAPAEFLPKEEVERKYGYLDNLIGGGIFNLKPGETTDDTAMTLAVMKGMLSNWDEPLLDIGREFIAWSETDPPDIGIITKYALLNYSHDQNWDKASKKAHERLLGKSAGNGSLMRCLPIALAYDDLQKVEELSRSQSKMTHYDPLTGEICALYNRIAFRVLHEKKNLQTIIYEEIVGTRFAPILIRDPDCLPTGFVEDTFSWVLRVLITEDDYEGVVRTLANKGEDADTTAAIAGGLKGLSVGYEKLPERWIVQLIEKENMNHLTTRFYKRRKDLSTTPD